jgi:hypothetical protein
MLETSTQAWWFDIAKQHKVGQLVKKGSVERFLPAKLKINKKGLTYKNTSMRRKRFVPWSSIAVFTNRPLYNGPAGTLSEEYYYHFIRFYVQRPNNSKKPHWLNFKTCCTKEKSKELISKINKYYYQ